MKRELVTLTAMLGVLAVVANGASAVPNTVNFTGRITQDGVPLPDGTVNLSFELFDAPSGGSTTGWAETYGNTQITNGLVHIALGSQNGFSDEDFDGSELYLEIVVNGDVQSPRIPIRSTPYAFRASSADKLGNLRPDDVAPSDHDHPGNAFTCRNIERRFTVSAGRGGAEIATCPLGEIMTGGGCSYDGVGASSRQVMGSHPYRQAPDTTWHCLMWNTGTSSYEATVVARCCRLVPE